MRLPTLSRCGRGRAGARSRDPALRGCDRAGARAFDRRDFSSPLPLRKRADSQLLSSEQLFHVYISLLLLLKLEELACGEVEHVGDDDVGELLDAHVVDVDALVVELAAIGDRVLQRADAR